MAGEAPTQVWSAMLLASGKNSFMPIPLFMPDRSSLNCVPEVSLHSCYYAPANVCSIIFWTVTVTDCVLSSIILGASITCNQTAVYLPNQKAQEPKIKMISKRFVNRKRAGRGSFGTVTVCKDMEHGGRSVALKETRNDLSEGLPYDFIRERTALMCMATTTTVLRLFGVDWQAGPPTLILEGMQRSLADEIRRRTQIDRNDAQHYLAQIEAGIKHIHSRGFMHRDVKPANCLVEKLKLKIGDLGTSILYIKGRCNSLDVFTRCFAAPEILLGDAQYTQSVDIWSIGCTYIAMRTGQPPFRCSDTSVWGMMVTIMQHQGRPNEECWAGVSNLPHFSEHWPACRAGHPDVHFPQTPVTRGRRFDAFEVRIVGGLLTWDPSARTMLAESTFEPLQMVERVSLKNQCKVNSKMRYILVDWLMEVSVLFRLSAMSFHLSVLALDVFLSNRPAMRSRLQLLGVAALCWSSKLMETAHPPITDYVYVCDKIYTAEQIKAQEIEIDMIAHEFGVDPRQTLRYQLETDEETISLSKASSYACDLLTLDESSYGHHQEDLRRACKIFHPDLSTTQGQEHLLSSTDELLRGLHDNIPLDAFIRKRYS